LHKSSEIKILSKSNIAARFPIVWYLEPKLYFTIFVINILFSVLASFYFIPKVDIYSIPKINPIYWMHCILVAGLLTSWLTQIQQRLKPARMGYSVAEPSFLLLLFLLFIQFLPIVAWTSLVNYKIADLTEEESVFCNFWYLDHLDSQYLGNSRRGWKPDESKSPLLRTCANLTINNERYPFLFWHNSTVKDNLHFANEYIGIFHNSENQEKIKIGLEELEREINVLFATTLEKDNEREMRFEISKEFLRKNQEFYSLFKALITYTWPISPIPISQAITQ